MNNKTKGFTLAEVLITLGIIGVVAALTIPTLIANTNANKFRSQFKKTVSTISNAARMSQAQYGFDFAAEFPLFTSKEANATPEEETSPFALFNGTLSGYTFIDNNDAISNYRNNMRIMVNEVADDNYVYQLSDGSLFTFTPGLYHECHMEPGEQGKDMSGCYGVIDVNGYSLPNKEVTCSDGTDTMFVWDENYQDCVVKNDANHMTDIYPVFYHDSIVEPATNAAKYVLNTAK
ncbi:type II secretion system protein [bacterium]|nr:type II secretion system protein [bacterium]